jgi:hypothetical protein
MCVKVGVRDLPNQPESAHPGVEILGAQTFDVEGGGVRVEMDVLAACGGGDGGMRQSQLVAGGLPWAKRVAEYPRAMQHKVTTRKACKGGNIERVLES